MSPEKSVKKGFLRGFFASYRNIASDGAFTITVQKNVTTVLSPVNFRGIL